MWHGEAGLVLVRLSDLDQLRSAAGIHRLLKNPKEERKIQKDWIRYTLMCYCWIYWTKQLWKWRCRVDLPQSQPVLKGSCFHSLRWQRWRLLRALTPQPWQAGSWLVRLYGATRWDAAPARPPGPMTPARPQPLRWIPLSLHTLQQGMQGNIWVVLGFFRALITELFYIPVRHLLLVLLNSYDIPNFCHHTHEIVDCKFSSCFAVIINSNFLRLDFY